MHWVVVGGGTAGCVVASRLTDDPGNHVTLVEAGSDRGAATSASYLDDLATPGAVWDGLVVSDGESTTRPYPQGRGLGGSSAVNGGVLSGGEPWGEVVAGPELGLVDRALIDAGGEPALLSRRDAQRVSVADVYLRPVLGRTNLDVLTGAEVDAVALEGRTAVGAVLRDGTVVRGDRIVCCAGAIFTPALLLRSGIAAPGVGEGLRDHVGRVVELTLRSPADVDGLVTGAVLRRDAIEIVTMNHLGRDAPDRGALLVGLLRNERQGNVRIDGSGSPVVDFGLLSDSDRAVLDDGVALALELLSRPGFSAVVSDVSVADGFGGYAHACCSCAAAVDGSWSVRGYEGLYVCDASVLPRLPPSGTYVPVVELAEVFSRICATR